MRFLKLLIEKNKLAFYIYYEFAVVQCANWRVQLILRLVYAITCSLYTDDCRDNGDDDDKLFYW